jgi:hypothetical protein
LKFLKRAAARSVRFDRNKNQLFRRLTNLLLVELALLGLGAITRPACSAEADTRPQPAFANTAAPEVAAARHFRARFHNVCDEKHVSLNDLEPAAHRFQANPANHEVPAPVIYGTTCLPKRW